MTGGIYEIAISCASPRGWREGGDDQPDDYEQNGSIVEYSRYVQGMNSSEPPETKTLKRPLVGLCHVPIDQDDLIS